MTYITGYQLQPASGTLTKKEECCNEEQHRHVVLSPNLFHTNLSPLYHSIFFQMCKAHYIGYDPTVKLGTLFNLVDDEHREHLGMICVQNTLLKTIQTCSFNLSTIHREISTISMQGQSNFKTAIRELDKIAELIR